MDFLACSGALSLGVGLGYWARGFRPLIRTEVHFRDRAVVPANGPEAAYVRFHFADGTVNVKKFKARDITPVMEWKGRTFAASEWTPDGHVFNEVVA